MEQDSRFPSGAWTGFFLQRPSTTRHWMELRLAFRQGTLSGDGRDTIGQFTIDGRYEPKDGRCSWTKRYVGKHEVTYTGYNEGKGIWGVWEIAPLGRGGFHIWPVGMDDPTQQRRTEAEEVPVEAISTGGSGPGEVSPEISPRRSRDQHKTSVDVAQPPVEQRHSSAEAHSATPRQLDIGPPPMPAANRARSDSC